MKKLKGTIVSTKLDKSCTVSVVSKFRHPKYNKIVSKSKKYIAHNDTKADMGDFVEIIETRPISRKKHFKVSEIITKSNEK